jgi:PAS domain S-box-containing protein
MSYLFKYLIVKILLMYYSMKGYGVIIYNYLGCIVDINNKACKILEYKKFEIKGKSFLMLLPKEKVLKNLIYFEDIISHDKNINFFVERTRRTKSGILKKILIKPIRFKFFHIFVSIVKL